MTTIEVGDFYTTQSAHYAREIIDIFGSDVTYQEYDLQDGTRTGYRRKCVRGTFKRWAFRACTEEEISRLSEERSGGTKTRAEEPAHKEGENVEILAGRIYTNHTAAFAREVLEIKSRVVKYQDFDLSDGYPMVSRSECDIQTFRNWAGRLCTPEETARLQRDKPARTDEPMGKMAAELMAITLAALTDNQLLAEVRRRGLSIGG